MKRGLRFLFSKKYYDIVLIPTLKNAHKNLHYSSTQRYTVSLVLKKKCGRHKKWVDARRLQGHKFT